MQNFVVNGCCLIVAVAVGPNVTKFFFSKFRDCTVFSSSSYTLKPEEHIIFCRVTAQGCFVRYSSKLYCFFIQKTRVTGEDLWLSLHVAVWLSHRALLPSTNLLQSILDTNVAQQCVLSTGLYTVSRGKVYLFIFLCLLCQMLTDFNNIW